MEKSNLLAGKDPSEINFIAAISHDMRTPLSNVLGFAEILAMDETDNKERKALVSAILRNGQMLLRLVDDILDLARIEALQLVLHPKDCSLNELLNEVHADLELRASSRGIALVFEGLPNDVRVVADNLRIKQMLLNIVGNALKFTSKGSVRLQLEVMPTEDVSSVQKHNVIFRISDTGIGISPEGVEKLFTPFAQANSMISQNYGGTGLGLVISRNLARLMGGDIKLISSEVGVGSVFEASVITEACSWRDQKTAPSADLASL